MKRAAEGGLPFFDGGGHRGGFGHRGPVSLDAAATYLGMTQPECLRSSNPARASRRSRRQEEVSRRPRRRPSRPTRRRSSTPPSRTAGSRKHRQTRSKADDRATRRPRQREVRARGSVRRHHGFGGPPMSIPGAGVQPGAVELHSGACRRGRVGSTRLRRGRACARPRQGWISLPGARCAVARGPALGGRPGAPPPASRRRLPPRR